MIKTTSIFYFFGQSLSKPFSTGTILLSSPVEYKGVKAKGF